MNAWCHMKLSSLYTNNAKVFQRIDFNEGLNVILGEIRHPKNRGKDSHNLGKSILVKLIDFCLLSGKKPEFFLFKHIDRFQNFIFFLEICYGPNKYVTIRRSVEDATRIAFKKHSLHRQDLQKLEEKDWDHFNIPFEKSKLLLDGILGLTAIAPWDYRKGLGYLLRTQGDFLEVFQLRKFAGGHADWKPFLAQMLGFDGSLLLQEYEAEATLANIESQANVLRLELGGSPSDINKIDGLLLLAKAKATKKEAFLSAFDLKAYDQGKIKELIDEISTHLSELNKTKYYLLQNKKQIDSVLDEGQILFDPQQAEELFREASILFPGQIKHDFNKLIEFNRSITQERIQYLSEERDDISAKVKEINSTISKLNKRRTTAFSNVQEKDVFIKFKAASAELIEILAEVTALERQKTQLEKLNLLRREINDAKRKKDEIIQSIDQNVQSLEASEEGLYSSIRLFFNELIQSVTGYQALLSASLNSEGHVNFKAELLNDKGAAVSTDDGWTYKKIMCIAFDMAVVRAHLDLAFPKFIYHDGIFESVDIRKRQNLLDVLREYTDLGVQHIITLLDSDLPPSGKKKLAAFSDDDIILRLHDGGDDGRLFKMPEW